MLNEFLKKLGATIGITYTKDEFGKMIAEAGNIKVSAEIDQEELEEKIKDIISDPNYISFLAAEVAKAIEVKPGAPEKVYPTKDDKIEKIQDFLKDNKIGFANKDTKEALLAKVEELKAKEQSE